MLKQTYSDRIYYEWQPNQGVSRTRNRAIALSQGSFIAYLDSDDMWLPDKLALQMRVMAGAARRGPGGLPRRGDRWLAGTGGAGSATRVAPRGASCRRRHSLAVTLARQHPCLQARVCSRPARRQPGHIWGGLGPLPAACLTRWCMACGVSVCVPAHPSRCDDSSRGCPSGGTA